MWLNPQAEAAAAPEALLVWQVLDADVPAPSSATVKAWRSEQHAHESETEAVLSFMQHHAVNRGVSDVGL